MPPTGRRFPTTGRWSPSSRARSADTSGRRGRAA